MAIEHARVGDVLVPSRRPLTVEPTAEYVFLGISAAGGGLFKKPAVTGSTLRSGSAFTIRLGDFVYSRLFAWAGSFEIAGAEEDGCVVSGEFPAFEVDLARLDPRWLRYWLLSEPGLCEVRDRSAGSTPGSRNRLREDRFLTIPVPLPTLNEQRRVADMLDRLRASVEDILHRSDYVEKLMVAVTVSASARPDLDEDTKLGRGWRHVALGQVLNPSTNHVQVEPMTNYQVAGLYSFGRGLIDRGSMLGAQTSYKTFTVLSEGDIVVSKLNGWEGAVAVVDRRFDGFCVSSEYPTFKPASALLPAFFGGVARAPWFWEALNSNTRGSMVRRRRINSREFLGTDVWLPPMETQLQIAEWLEILDRSSEARSGLREWAEALVPSAMNEAFAGLS